MDLSSRLADIGTERALLALGAIVVGLLAVAMFQTGSDDRGALYALFSLYLGGAATPAVRDSVPQFKRTGAIALAGVGAVALFLGIESALPMLFIIGGIAAVLDLF